MQGKLFLPTAPKASRDYRRFEKTTHSKTRTGCLRCKSRRVKCDEEKPACQRCRRLNFECPGYNAPKARIFGLAQNDCFTSDLDKLCFESFLADGDRHMAQFQPSSYKFWFEMVPQLSQVLTSIRHTVIALGILQEPVRSKQAYQAVQSKGLDYNLMVIQHFNLAIRDFVQASASLSTEAKLTCCVLFTALQTYLEHSSPPPVHILAADKLLNEYERGVMEGQQVLDPTIVKGFKPIIQRLLIDVAAFQDVFQNRQMRRYDAFDQFSATLFQTLADVNDVPATAEHISLLLKYSVAIHFRDIPPDSQLSMGVRTALKDLESVILREYPSSPASDSLRQNSETGSREYDLTVLLLNCRAIWILANTRVDEETMYDGFTNDFSRILSLGEHAVAMTYTPWQTSLGVQPALFLVATKCRVRHLRHKALKLIHAASNFERAWSSCTGFTIARVLIVVEEQLQPQAADEVNGSDRVSLQSIRVDHASGSAAVRFHICRRTGERIPFQFILPPSYVMVEERRKGLGTLTDRIVQVCGYSGTQLHMPSLSCHCAKTFLTWTPEMALQPENPLWLHSGNFHTSPPDYGSCVSRVPD